MNTAVLTHLGRRGVVLGFHHRLGRRFHRRLPVRRTVEVGHKSLQHPRLLYETKQQNSKYNGSLSRIRVQKTEIQHHFSNIDVAVVQKIRKTTYRKHKQQYEYEERDRRSKARGKAKGFDEERAARQII